MSPVNKSCALENSARVQNGTAPPRVSSKTRGAANMDRHFGFALPLRDIQGWKSNGSRMAHGDVGLQLAKSRRGVDKKWLSRRRCVVVN